jgi:hypothetical protein
MIFKRTKEWWLRMIDSEPDDVTIGAGLPDRPAGASAQCPHSDLHFHLNNACFGNTNLHYLELTATCKICEMPMVFRGARMGMGADEPRTSVDGTEIRIPFIGAGEELIGEPAGYSVTLR